MLVLWEEWSWCAHFDQESSGSVRYSWSAAPGPRPRGSGPRAPRAAQSSPTLRRVVADSYVDNPSRQHRLGVLVVYADNPSRRHRLGVLLDALSGRWDLCIHIRPPELFKF